MNHDNKLLLTLLFLMIALPGRQIFAAPQPVSDVRILIDVSGSMKKNDPKQLRSPALEMMVGLLPEQSKAGVWTFARYVNLLVPHQEVDDKWRQQAQQQSSKIHSRGLFTNIEQAINKATANQTDNDPEQKRSVILLSDGLVDIDTKPQPSVESRDRILKEVVPRLKEAKIAVHTIALSGDSDQALLREVALQTDGWYEQIDTAEQLQKTFLHLFEKVAQTETIPIAEENRFKVDDTVTEMTILVFRKEGAEPTQLIRPDQSQLDSMTQETNVRWLMSESGYDLITIDQPQTGEWAIQAKFDPDNRVMILTDLKLATTELPNNIVIGENFDFDVSLTNQDKVIQRESFLNLVDTRVTQENEVSDFVEQDLNNNIKEGVYRTQIGEAFQAGRNDIVTTVLSATFERQRRQSINVVEMPFTISTEQLDQEATRTHRVLLEPDTSLVNNEKTSIAALLTAEDGSEWSYDVLPTVDGNWQLTLADLEDSKMYKINLQIKSETLKGRPLFLQPEEITLTDELADIMPPGDLTEQITGELDLLEQETQIDEAVQTEPELESELVPEDNLLDESIEDDLSNLIEDVDELSPLGEIGLEDELDNELDSLDGLLDESAIDDFEQMQDQDNTEATTKEISTNTLMIGNVIFALLAVMGFVFWRRYQAANPNPGEQL